MGRKGYITLPPRSCGILVFVLYVFLYSMILLCVVLFSLLFVHLCICYFSLARFWCG